VRWLPFNQRESTLLSTQPYPVIPGVSANTIGNNPVSGVTDVLGPPRNRRARKEREALLAAAASRSKAADEEMREKLQKAKQVRGAQFCACSRAPASPAGLRAPRRCLCCRMHTAAPLLPRYCRRTRTLGMCVGRNAWLLVIYNSCTCAGAARQDESERLQQIAANQALQTATGAAGKWAKWGQKKGAAAGAAHSLCTCASAAKH
jgi:hypothetical protein